MSVWLDMPGGRVFPSEERAVWLLGFVINEGKIFLGAFNGTSNGTRKGFKRVRYKVCRKMRWTPFGSDGGGGFPNWTAEYSCTCALHLFPTLHFQQWITYRKFNTRVGYRIVPQCNNRTALSSKSLCTSHLWKANAVWHHYLWCWC